SPSSSHRGKPSGCTTAAPLPSRRNCSTVRILRSSRCPSTLTATAPKSNRSLGMHVIVVGCGRVGSEVALNLSASDEHDVVIIDRKVEGFDRLGGGFKG